MHEKIKLTMVALLVVLALMVISNVTAETNVNGSENAPVDCASMYAPACGGSCIIPGAINPSNPNNQGICYARNGGGCFCYGARSKYLPYYGGEGTGDIPLEGGNFPREW